MMIAGEFSFLGKGEGHCATAETKRQVKNNHDTVPRNQKQELVGSCILY